MTSGDFNMAFSETWGPPYDPHSYAKSWSAPDEAHYSQLTRVWSPLWTKDVLDGKIDKLLTVEDEGKRQEAWAEVLADVHEQAVNLPFSGKAHPCRD